MAKPKAKQSKTETAKAKAERKPLVDFDLVIDQIEKDYSLSGSEMDRKGNRLSTGLLNLDILLGKGIIPGWYTLFGAEQCGKSTTATIIMSAALNSNVPILCMWDFEGSTSPDYLSNILQVHGIKVPIEEVFGIRDDKGAWVIKPRVRYYSETVGEKFFDYLAKLERTLPDKKKIKDQWFYIFEDNKRNKHLANKGDPDYYKRTGMIKIPCTDGDTLQALLLVDSYPAMLPEKQDVDDPNSAIAVQARMFSDQLKRVKGRLRAKRIAVLGINQLREKPMAMFGSPFSEPGGTALKLYSDARFQLSSRSVPHGKGQLEEEPSIDRTGVDTYRYVNAKTVKNKLSVPLPEAWFRIWVTDSKGEARGIDPVYDCYQYLLNTGQIKGSLKSNKIKLQLDSKEPATKVLKWLEFKSLILGDRDLKIKICKYIGVKPFDLRKFCHRQLSDGNGLDLFFKHKALKQSKKEETDD